MKRSIFGAWSTAALVMSMLTGCALRHSISDDADVTIPRREDSGIPRILADAALPVDSPLPPTPTGPVVCGPNVCRTAEICCDETCGVCGFEGECPSRFECPVPRERRE